ncbi:hypothetical protein AAY473_002423 [Plecturocebus cupreus]
MSRGSGQAVGWRRAPGCGRCLELLTPAAWLPPASQSSNKRGRRRGEEEEPGGSAAPFTQQPKPGPAARAAPWGRPRSGGGGGSEGASLLETPSSSTKRVLSWPVWNSPPPTSPSGPLPVWEPRLTGESPQVSTVSKAGSKAVGVEMGLLI